MDYTVLFFVPARRDMCICFHFSTLILVFSKYKLLAESHYRHNSTQHPHSRFVSFKMRESEWKDLQLFHTVGTAVAASVPFLTANKWNWRMYGRVQR